MSAFTTNVMTVMIINEYDDFCVGVEGMWWVGRHFVSFMAHTFSRFFDWSTSLGIGELR